MKAYISVGIATDYGLDGPGSIPGKIFLLLTASRPTLEPNQAMGTGGDFVGKKAAGA
jgi:hypothetical protein